MKELTDNGYSIYSDDFKNLIRGAKKGAQRESAVIFAGGNKKDEDLEPVFNNPSA